jgi:transposase
MSEKNKRKLRRFDKEFKINAARLVVEQNMSRSQVGRDLGVATSLIANWVKDYQCDVVGAFPGKGKLSPQDQRLRDLEQENRKLRMERDILKKAAAYFASHGG